MAGDGQCTRLLLPQSWAIGTRVLLRGDRVSLKSECVRRHTAGFYVVFLALRESGFWGACAVVPRPANYHRARVE